LSPKDNSPEIKDTDLFLVSENQYGIDYKKHLIKQYEILIEMADRVSARRATANTFFLSINAFLATILGLIIDTSFGGMSPFALIIIMSSVGILICGGWRTTILSYKSLNSAKFQIINRIEKKLPVIGYSIEWSYLNAGGKYGKYVRLSVIEGRIPVIFSIIYVILFLYSLFFLWLGNPPLT